MARTFTREQFYELVWSKPLTHLAREFLLSDVALHKICKKHEIPNPPLGWWAKKAAGQKVAKTPLPRAKPGFATQITISGGEIRQEPDLVADAREKARIAISSLASAGDTGSHPVVERTVAKLRKAKPSEINGLVSVGGAGLIKAEVAPTSIDRLEQALNRIATACDAIGIKLLRGEGAATFSHDGEVIGFSVTEVVQRQKHEMTEKEKSEEEAWRKKQQRRWSRNEWDMAFDFSSPRFPEWDYHPTGKLSFDLEHMYFLVGSPRRSFRDAKIQRLEAMASEIAVGIAVMAAAKKEDQLRRAEAERQRLEERHRRELALRAEFIEQRRGKALDEILEEVANLDRLRRLVNSLTAELDAVSECRVGDFLAFARQRLVDCEASLSTPGLKERFEANHLFGDDDDNGFRPPAYFY